MLIILRSEVLNREEQGWRDDGSHHANRPTNHDARNGSTSACRASLMDSRDAKAMLQFIVGARQTLDVIALEEASREVGGLMTKMLKCPLKRSQRGDLAAHLRNVRQIPFPDVLTGVLLRVNQDRFCLIQEAIGVLQWWPQCRRGLQAFRKKLLQQL